MPDEALDQVSLARTSNPNSPMAILIEAHILMHTGRPEQARQGLTAFLRVDPRGPRSAAVIHWFAVSYYYERNYQMSVEASRRWLARYPGVPDSYRGSRQHWVS